MWSANSDNTVNNILHENRYQQSGNKLALIPLMNTQLIFHNISNFLVYGLHLKCHACICNMYIHLLSAMLYVRHLFYLSLTVIHWKFEKLCGYWYWNTRREVKFLCMHVLMGSRFTHQLSIQKPLVLSLTHLQLVLHIVRSHDQHSCWQCSGSSLHLPSAHWKWLVWSCLLLESSPHHTTATLLSHFLFLSPTGTSKVLFQWLGQWV